MKRFISKLIVIFVVMAMITACGRSDDMTEIVPVSDSTIDSGADAISGAEDTLDIPTVAPASTEAEEGMLSAPDAELIEASSSAEDEAVEEIISLPGVYTAESDEYIGEIEIDGMDYPLLIANDLAYAILEDHAEIVYAGINDTLCEAYDIFENITYEGIEYPVTVIGDNGMFDCSEVKKIIIPEGITSVGISAFESCMSLEEIILPSSLTCIGDNAFSGCENLRSIIIPDSVTNIGEDCFDNCTALTSVVWSANCRTIPAGTFTYCESLSEVSIPEGVVAIDKEAFWGCTALQSPELPESLVSIGDRAFYGCFELESVTFPAGLVVLGEEVFDFCDSLGTIKLPAENYETLYENLEALGIEIETY